MTASRCPFGDDIRAADEASKTARWVRRDAVQTGLTRFFRYYLQLHLFRPPQHGQRASHSDPDFGQQSMKIIYSRYRLTFERDDHIAFPQPATLGRTVLLHM